MRFTGRGVIFKYDEIFIMTSKILFTSYILVTLLATLYRYYLQVQPLCFLVFEDNYLRFHQYRFSYDYMFGETPYCLVTDTIKLISLLT